MYVEPAVEQQRRQFARASSDDTLAATFAWIGGVAAAAFVVSSVVLHAGLVDARLYLELALSSALVYGAALTFARLGGDRLRLRAASPIRRPPPVRCVGLARRANAARRAR
jgi:uncharacterized membrane protein YdcZ (DUF606 family)